MADIDKHKVGAAFDKAASIYDGLADFQQRVCEKLAATLPMLSASSILDGGCGTGNSAEFLSAQWPDAMLVGCDLSLQMLAQASTTQVGPRVRRSGTTAF
jgi:trans-aconitate methyltransferase